MLQKSNLEASLLNIGVQFESDQYSLECFPDGEATAISQKGSKNCFWTACLQSSKHPRHDQRNESPPNNAEVHNISDRCRTIGEEPWHGIGSIVDHGISGISKGIQLPSTSTVVSPGMATLLSGSRTQQVQSERSRAFQRDLFAQ